MLVCWLLKYVMYCTLRKMAYLWQSLAWNGHGEGQAVMNYSDILYVSNLRMANCTKLCLAHVIDITSLLLANNRYSGIYPLCIACCGFQFSSALKFGNSDLSYSTWCIHIARKRPFAVPIPCSVLETQHHIMILWAHQIISCLPNLMTHPSTNSSHSWIHRFEMDDIKW